MRGYRFQQANRIARKALGYPANIWVIKLIGQHEYKQVLGILRKTRKRCSCWGCGNRRQYEGPTIQERRQFE